MFIIQLTYLKPLEVIDQYLLAHRSFLEEGYKKDYFVASGPMNPRTGGIIISQLTDRKTLETLLENDPFYSHGLAEYKITEFEPVKFHPNFASFINSCNL